MTKTIDTENRRVSYDIDKKTNLIKVTGDSFGILKDTEYKLLSELEKMMEKTSKLPLNLNEDYM